MKALKEAVALRPPDLCGAVLDLLQLPTRRFVRGAAAGYRMRSGSTDPSQRNLLVIATPNCLNPTDRRCTVRRWYRSLSKNVDGPAPLITAETNSMAEAEWIDYNDRNSMFFSPPQ